MAAPPSVGAHCPQVNVRSCLPFQASLLYSAMMSYFKTIPFCSTLFLPPILGVWGRKISRYSPLPRWTYHLSQIWPFQFHIHSFKKKTFLRYNSYHKIQPFKGYISMIFSIHRIYHHYHLSLEDFYHPPKETPYPLTVTPHPTPCLEPLIFLSLWICLFGHFV